LVLLFLCGLECYWFGFTRLIFFVLFLLWVAFNGIGYYVSLPLRAILFAYTNLILFLAFVCCFFWGLMLGIVFFGYWLFLGIGVLRLVFWLYVVFFCAFFGFYIYFVCLI